MDKTGLWEGLGFEGVVLGHSEKRSALAVSPDSTEWITMLECISADGRVLTPLDPSDKAIAASETYPSFHDIYIG